MSKKSNVFLTVLHRFGIEIIPHEAHNVRAYQTLYNIDDCSIR